MYSHGICQRCWKAATPLLRDIFREAATYKDIEPPRYVQVKDEPLFEIPEPTLWERLRARLWR